MDEEKEVTSINDRELTKMEMLDQWLKELVYPGDINNFIQEISGQGNEESIKRKICLYTQENRYFIVAVEYSNGNKDYLGCQVSSRKARAGEDWIRGNDLPDGPFTRKTWDTIINAIVSYELVKLSEYQKPDTAPVDITENKL